MAHYDLAVIGAGIHGAAVANAAATRGHKVVVLEQYPEAACGTSSKSSKLIHGGLRYLESGQFRLVRECLVERRRLLEEQPDLVTLAPFHIPVFRHGRRSAWVIAAGLGLYTLLGGGGFRRIARKDWPGLDGLTTHGLTAVFRYWDAQTDDKRLTERIIGNAESRGARVCYGATFTSARCAAAGCNIVFEAADGTDSVSADAIVNAAGPWANRVLQAISPAVSSLDIELVQGTHIIVPGTLQRGIYYLESPLDQRAVFVMPWQGNTMIGTTETPYSGDPAGVTPLETEIEYLLQTRNHYFEKPIARADVIDCFAGLRVLPTRGGDPFHRSRDTLLHRDAHLPNLVTIYGGKLTSHHATAMRVIRQLGLSRPKPVLTVTDTSN
jgi:glycerol-3-phosphate dehydrogenase